MIKNALAAASIIAAGLTLAFPAFAQGADAPAFRFGICDWTIGKSGDPAALALAGSLGLDGVQVSLNPKGDSLALLDPALRRAYAEAQEKTGVAIPSFAIGELNGVPLKSDPRAEKWLAEGIGIARDMGVKIILVPFFGKGDIRNDAPGTEAVIQALRRLAPKAQAAGIVLALEGMLTAGDLTKVLDRVGSPAVRAYYDVANPFDAGYPILDEIRELGPRICEFHAKDTKGLYGKGSIDFPAVRKAMDGIGYRGWVVLEGTDMSLGLEKSVRYDLEYLEKVFAAGPAKAGDPWQPLEFLLGEWRGLGSGAPGEGEGGSTFGFELDRKVLVRKNWAKYPPKPGESAGLSHEDLLFIYPRPGGPGFSAIYFDNEGHVISYALTFPAVNSVAFETPAGQPGPRFRLTYALGADGILKNVFLMAQPGGEFKTYVEGKLKRK